MSATHRSGGNRFSHEVGTGYRNASRFSSKWERPEGELTWWQGAALLIFIALAGLGLTLAFGS